MPHRSRLAATIIWCCMFAFRSFAQDVQQAQFFAIPVMSNPAFAGNMEFDCKELKSNFRGSWQSRRQWGAAFSSDAMVLELFRKKSRMGMALNLRNQRVNGGHFSANSGGLAISHRLNLGNEWHLASGVQLDVVQRGFSFTGLRFTDQFSENGYTGRTGSDNAAGPAFSRVFPDLATGLLAFNQRFWTGISVHHLTRPVLSDINGSIRLERKFTLQAGLKIPFRSEPNFGLFRRDVSLHPVWQWRIQQPFSQMDAGMYYNHEPFVAGLLYRGFAILKKDADNRISQDAIVFLLGIKHEGFRMGYSIELNLKRKGYGSFPSQELSLSYQLAKNGCLRRRYGKWIPVPSI